MASPTVRSSNNSAHTTATTTHNVSYPATISSGDLLVCMFLVDVAQTELTWPSEWMASPMVNGGGSGMHLAFTIATGSESGTFSVTSDTSQESHHIVYSVQSWSGSLGDVTWNGIAATASVASKDPPAVVPGFGSQDYMFIAGCCIDSSKTISGWPTNYSSNQVTSNGFLTLAAATYGATAASDDPDAFSYSGADDGGAFTIAIPPSGLTNSFPKIIGMRTDLELSDTTAPVVNMPGTISSGNLILWAIACDGAPSITVPTTLGTFTLIDTTANGTATKIAVYGKIADGTEDSGNMTLTTGSEQFCIGVWIIDDWSGTIADIETALSDGSSTTPDPASLTPSWGADNALWAYFGSTDAGSGITLNHPTNYGCTLNFQGNAAGCSMFAGFSRQNTTTVDPSSLTIAPSDNWAVVHLAIKPAPVSGSIIPIAMHYYNQMRRG